MFTSKDRTILKLKTCNRAAFTINGKYYFLNDLINFALRLSALEFCKDKTAHIAAGIQPIKVICKIKQINAVKILPLNKKEIHGKNIAINVIV